ncbi:MAG TPA: molybdenum cofactor biosynthesis protein MoaE [Chthoniobacterales bacterium]|nr:molybdenum cofactor biosynthesis protein MoaE [Chthoniobacterales bacterium]
MIHIHFRYLLNVAAPQRETEWRKQMATWHSQIVITTSALEAPAKRWDGAVGATVEFWGVVRSLEDGRAISGIEYEAHQLMAKHQMELIAQAAHEKFLLDEVLLHHRIGFVAAGEPSLYLRVSSSHRGEAFEASAWIVSELKQKVPIWKRPLFASQDQPSAVAS